MNRQTEWEKNIHDIDINIDDIQIYRYRYLPKYLSPDTEITFINNKKTA